MKVESLISQIAADLNDNLQGHEFTTWPKASIRAWIIEGINLIYDKRPDLFMGRKVIQVQPCSIIQDTCDCNAIRRVTGQVTKDGRTIGLLRERSLELSFQWTAPTCRRTLQPGVPFRLESYAVDEVSDTLYIYPQVPPDVEAFVEVECSIRPEEAQDTSDIKSDYVAAIIQWALWRGKSIDMEIAPAAQAAAQMHYRAFFEVLGLEVDAKVVIHKRSNT